MADPGSEMIAAAMPKGSSNRQAVNSAMRAFADDGTMNHFVHVWVGSAADDAEKSLPLIQTNRVT